MAIADVAAAHQDDRRPFGKPMPDEILVNPPRAHGPNEPHVRRILEPGNPGVIRTRIRAPVACESKDLLPAFVFQKSIDLVQDLDIGEVIHGDGAEGAFRRASAATGTCGGVHHSGLLPLDIHRDGIVRADFGTFPAGLAVLHHHFGCDGLREDLSPVHETNRSYRSRGRLCHALLDVFGTLGATCVKDPPCSRINGLQLGMRLQEEPVGGELKTQHLLQFLCMS